MREFYLTYELARASVHKLKITNGREYKQRRDLDILLPADPKTYYLSVWHMRGGYKNFYLHVEKYTDYGEARVAAISTKAKTAREYLELYKANPRLPSDPSSKYKHEWAENNGWKGFLGKSDIRDKG